ncbi:hypothetical protein GCM10011491_41320 [Brucella endophytica]|uniref:Uncharacterized protein n=1 Tax=Brucella endophytica TaxID=1963359 RepID=A0A916SND9_9HYPH|nr:hypothetical protein [Brucella endophytica]GGB09096.1 hypothetical protein GCM10011491_41320 [Brucella endophytica]
MDERTYAEKYAMRSRFYQILGEAGKLLADAYTQADAENQAGIKDMAFDAMVASLVEHHGYDQSEIR